MIIQKLRLQRGWSQEQLAEISGLSVRTIQRLEKGQSGSLESLKALAAVFEVDLHQLQGEQTMTEQHIETGTVIQKQENEALSYAQKLRHFYLKTIVFTLILMILAVINYFTSDYWWVLWVWLGFAVHLAISGFKLFVKENLFSGKWEQKVVEKRLGRKL